MQISAMIGNANGGKQKSSEPVKEEEIYTPLDFIPPFAQSPETEKKYLLKPQHCWMLNKMLENGSLKSASWVIHLVELDDNLERIIQVANGFNKIMELETIPSNGVNS